MGEEQRRVVRRRDIRKRWYSRVPGLSAFNLPQDAEGRAGTLRHRRRAGRQRRTGDRLGRRRANRFRRTCDRLGRRRANHRRTREGLGRRANRRRRTRDRLGRRRALALLDGVEAPGRLGECARGFLRRVSRPRHCVVPVCVAAIRRVARDMAPERDAVHITSLEPENAAHNGADDERHARRSPVAACAPVRRRGELGRAHCVADPVIIPLSACQGSSRDDSCSSCNSSWLYNKADVASQHRRGQV